jgi:ABC-type Mn2+/Zn2+ transport system ATPase subunit
VRALDGVSFSVPAGTIFGLLGPNGAGKSTTVEILTTLARADAGSARVAGVDVVRDPVAVRRAIGVVGQKNAVDREAEGGTESTDSAGTGPGSGRGASDDRFRSSHQPRQSVAREGTGR